MGAPVNAPVNEDPLERSSRTVGACMRALAILGGLMLMALIFTLLVLITHWTLTWLPLRGCLLPPCY